MNKLKIEETPTIYYLSLFITTVFFLLTAYIFDEQSNSGIIFGFILPQLGNALAYFGYAKFRKLDLKDTVIVSKVNIKGIVLCLIITIALYLQNLFIVSLANDFLKFINFSGGLTLPDLSKPMNVAWAILAICILPAIFEEIIFRGIFVGALKNVNETFAIVISALIFSLMHFNLVQIVHQFIVGAVLGFIYIKTKNLSYTIIIHFLNNFLAIMIIMINGGDIAIKGYWYILAIVMSIIGFVVLLNGLKLLCGKKDFLIKNDKDFFLNLKRNPSIVILLIFLLIVSIISAIITF